jgi:hypothetical protein
VTATFTNDPANSNRDAVRVLVNDTNTTNARLSDETIAWLLASEPSLLYAAAAGAEMIAANLVETPTVVKVGDLMEQKGRSTVTLRGEYTDLAKTLRIRASKGVTPFAGGLSVSDKDARRSDTDWPGTEIEVGLHDNVSGSTADNW